MATAEEIAWAAGLFEGEGCFTHADGVVNARLQMTDPDVLERFVQIIGIGYIYGPYTSGYRDGSKRKPRWVWVANGDERAREVLKLLAPWLGDRRLRRAHELGLFPIR